MFIRNIKFFRILKFKIYIKIYLLKIMHNKLILKLILYKNILILLGTSKILGKL